MIFEILPSVYGAMTLEAYVLLGKKFPSKRKRWILAGLLGLVAIAIFVIMGFGLLWFLVLRTCTSAAC